MKLLVFVGYVERNMTENLADLIMKVVNEPSPRPFAFEIGQTVRICVSCVEDGQTPLYWKGAVCKVVDRRATMFSKTHTYLLEHENGNQDYFEESELDYRYGKR